MNLIRLMRPIDYDLPVTLIKLSLAVITGAEVLRVQCSRDFLENADFFFEAIVG